MARRTYVPSLLYVAQQLCKLITRATPVIVVLYGDNAALMAALEAANAACAELVAQLAIIRETGD